MIDKLSQTPKKVTVEALDNFLFGDPSQFITESPEGNKANVKKEGNVIFAEARFKLNAFSSDIKLRTSINKSSREENRTFIKDNIVAFNRLAEAAQRAAIMDADGCGGVNERSQMSSTLESGNITNLSSFKAQKVLAGNQEHKTGAHDHCNRCNGDLTDGKCSKCAA